MNNNWRGMGEAVFTFTGLVGRKRGLVLYPTSVRWWWGGCCWRVDTTAWDSRLDCSAPTQVPRSSGLSGGLHVTSDPGAPAPRCLFVNQQPRGGRIHSHRCNGIHLIRVWSHVAWAHTEGTRNTWNRSVSGFICKKPAAELYNLHSEGANNPRKLI